VAHALKGFRRGGGAADVPVFVLRVGADDEEVVGGSDAAVAGSCREHNYVAGVNGDRFAAFAAENQISVAGGEAQHLVRGGVIVMEIVDSVAPLRRPLVGGEEVLHCFCEIVAGWKGVAVEEYRQRTVWHPAVGLEVELLRRRRCGIFNFGRRSFSASYGGGEDAGGEVSAVDRLHAYWMLGMANIVSGVGTRGCP